MVLKLWKPSLADILSTALPSGQDQVIALSEEAKSVREYVGQVPEARTLVGCNSDFLDQYRPNLTSHLTEAERTHIGAWATDGPFHAVWMAIFALRPLSLSLWKCSS